MNHRKQEITWKLIIWDDTMYTSTTHPDRGACYIPLDHFNCQAEIESEMAQHMTQRVEKTKPTTGLKHNKLLEFFFNSFFKRTSNLLLEYQKVINLLWVKSKCSFSFTSPCEWWFLRRTFALSTDFRPPVLDQGQKLYDQPQTWKKTGSDLELSTASPNSGMWENRPAQSWFYI